MKQLQHNSLSNFHTCIHCLSYRKCFQMIFSIQKCLTSLTSPGHSNPSKKHLRFIKKTIPRPAVCWSSNAAHNLQFITKTISNVRILWHKNSVGRAPRLSCQLTDWQWHALLPCKATARMVLLHPPVVSNEEFDFLSSLSCFPNSNKSFQSIPRLRCENFNRYASVLYFSDVVAQHAKKT